MSDKRVRACQETPCVPFCIGVEHLRFETVVVVAIATKVDTLAEAGSKEGPPLWPTHRLVCAGRTHGNSTVVVVRMESRYVRMWLLIGGELCKYWGPGCPH